MNQGTYLFSQLISIISPTSFKTCVKRYNGDYTEKARYRKLIQKWIKLEEFQKGMETNLEINKEGNLAGKKLGLFS